MSKKTASTKADTPHKGERGAILTKKQYDLILAFHKDGIVPSRIVLDDAEIGDPNQSTYNRTVRFKSWARRMYFRLSDEALIHRITGKIILPQEKFESAIMAAHCGGQIPNSTCQIHHSTLATIKKMMKKYTFGKRSFGMSEETVRDVVKSCTTGSCALKKKMKSNQKRQKKLGKRTAVSAEANAKILELQSSLPIVRPRISVSYETAPTPKTATITTPASLVTTSGSKSRYPMVYTNNIFNHCPPAVTASASTTAFLPHPGIPPNYIGVPQLPPGYTSRMYLVPHTPGSNFMSMLQATAPQTRQLNPGSNLPGHVLTSARSEKQLSRPSTFTLKGISSNTLDKAFGSNESKTGELGKMLTSKSENCGSVLLKSLASKSKGKKLDALKNTKTPELAKMLALPTLVKASTGKVTDNDTDAVSEPAPIKGPLGIMKKVVENVDSIVSTLNPESHETADKKTITICVFPFPTKSESSTINSVSNATAQVPTTLQSSDSWLAAEERKSISVPVRSLKAGLVNRSPVKDTTESSANTKKKLKAKISAKRLLKGSKSPALKNKLKLASSSKIECDNASLLLQDPDTQKSIKLDKPRLLHLLKKEKSSEVRALLLRTLRRLKKSKINPICSCLTTTDKDESNPVEKCQTDSDTDLKVSTHTDLPSVSELVPEDEFSQQAEWNRKCMSVLGETINMYDPLLCSTFPGPCENMEDFETDKFPFPDSGPLPQPHIWHNYEDISSQQHCFRRLLPVFQDMKLDIMRSVMRDHSATERLKKKIAYGESLIYQFRQYLGEFDS
ncbi:uncharacterized protein [Argopecten irradians]|uniref:uncharacterized protein n=1 Tax=Argopecten irradians TaxID=31199 RepID=UPI00371A2243